jgi:MFS family permease
MRPGVRGDRWLKNRSHQRFPGIILQLSPIARGYLLAFLLSLGVTVSNSFARFAYALVLPAMRSELDWNYAQAGGLNTANAIGYLIGAILTRLVIRFTGNRSLFIGGVLLTALAILATGLTRDLFWLGVWRLVSGITGAVAFISGGALSGNVVPERPQMAATTISIYFAGGGVGFILCGVGIPLLLDAAGPSAWPQAWIWMGATGFLMLVLCSAAALKIVEPNLESPLGDRAPVVATPHGVMALRAGLIAYAMFGLGYIGYMTFVIAWMRDHGASTLEVIAVWCTFGIASLLGPWLWRRPLQHWIPGRMLAAALATLAVGALLPLLHAGIVSMLVSAVLFGASMWNIPGSVTNLAKRALPKPAWGAAVATFTIVFSAGQIVGPVATGWLADMFGSLRVGLVLSVGVLAAGALVALAQRDVVRGNHGKSGT